MAIRIDPENPDHARLVATAEADRGPDIYPLARWLDGGSWLLARGVDYRSTARCANAIRRAAAAVGQPVRVRTLRSHIIIEPVIP